MGFFFNKKRNYFLIAGGLTTDECVSPRMVFTPAEAPHMLVVAAAISAGRAGNCLVVLNSTVFHHGDSYRMDIC